MLEPAAFLAGEASALAPSFPCFLLRQARWPGFVCGCPILAQSSKGGDPFASCLLWIFAFSLALPQAFDGTQPSIRSSLLYFLYLLYFLVPSV
jgi:hypothetical protein